MKWRKLAVAVLALAVLGMSVPAHAQWVREKVDLCSDYDLDSATLIYPVTTGQHSLIFGNPIYRNVPVTATTATGNLVAATAGTAPFQGLAVGDEIWLNIGGVLTGEKITTFTDANTLVVDPVFAATATYNSFGYRKFVPGTGAATDGWIPVAGYRQVAFSWQIKQSDAGSIDVQVECKVDGILSQSAPVFAKNYTTYGCATSTAGCEGVVIDPSIYDSCRLGFKINTDTSDAGANLEKISAQFVGYQGRN